MCVSVIVRVCDCAYVRVRCAALRVCCCEPDIQFEGKDATVRSL